MAPRFVTFEGLDGSGKSTHLRLAGRWLRSLGLPVEITHEPGGTELGDAIRRVFLDPRWGPVDGRVEALLIFASRRQHLLEVIEPALAAGRHVLCDRFTDSTFAYQGYGRGAPLEVLRELDRIATGGRRPDRTLVFDLPPGEARDRGNAAGRAAAGVDRLDAEELAFYRRVREGFQEMVRSEPERFRVVSTRGPVEEAEQAVRRALADLFEEGG